MSVRLVILSVVSAGLGAAAGWLWWHWWGPGPEGEVYETLYGIRWVPDTGEAGYDHFFSATGQYVALGLVVGLVVGLLGAVISQGREVVGLIGTLVAVAVAAWVAWAVGHALSPPDPRTIAEASGVGARLPSGIAIDGWSPYLAWPIGALVGSAAVLVAAPVQTRQPVARSDVHEPSPIPYA